MPNLKEIDCFDPARIDIIERAIDRVWDVVCHTEQIESPEETRKLIALCVLHQAQAGEENHIRIVNQSIVDYRRRRAFNIIRERQSRVQAR